MAGGTPKGIVDALGWDFLRNKGLKLCCDNGATFPAGPYYAGQWFLHIPTGRNILYQYKSSWTPIMSFGTMTVYVDKTDGLDNLEQGTGVDAAAFKTIQYAVDCIPGLVSGNVTININAESYDETVTVNGKNFTGNYTITLQGTLTVHDNITMDGNGVQGATVNQASIHEHGMVLNHYQNQLLKFTSGANNGLYRIIDSNSNDAGTANIVLCGVALTAQPLTNDTATVYTWGTTINNIVLNSAQVGVVLLDLAFDTSVCLGAIALSSVNAYRCSFTASGGVVAIYIGGIASVAFGDCFVSCSGTFGVQILQNSYCALTGTKVLGSVGAGIGVIAGVGGVFSNGGGNVIDTHLYGVYIATGIADFWAANVYNFIRNCSGAGAIGVYALTGGIGLNTAFNSYSGNTTNESAIAAQFAYID
jgi:hypothetical protein